MSLSRFSNKWSKSKRKIKWKKRNHTPFFFHLKRGASHENGSWEAKADKIFARLINNRWVKPNGLHAPQKTWVLNIPFNGESQIQSPRTNTGLGAGSSPQGPGLCLVMRGCLPLAMHGCVCVCCSFLWEKLTDYTATACFKKQSRSLVLPWELF